SEVLAGVKPARQQVSFARRALVPVEAHSGVNRSPIDGPPVLPVDAGIGLDVFPRFRCNAFGDRGGHAIVEGQLRDVARPLLEGPAAALADSGAESRRVRT